MSTRLAQSVSSSKITEKNRAHSVKAGRSKYSSRKQVQENPLTAQKSYQVPLTTPRKALGNLSNTPWQKKTAVDPPEAPKSTFKLKKASSQKRKTSVTASQKQECNDDVIDVEYMPLQSTKVSESDISAMPPTTYFRNLMSALKATTAIPPTVMSNINKEDTPAMLSICIERKPHYITGSIINYSEPLLQDDVTFEDFPDIPDFD